MILWIIFVLWLWVGGAILLYALVRIVVQSAKLTAAGHALCALWPLTLVILLILYHEAKKSGEAPLP